MRYRLVIDTNLLVSAYIIGSGLPARLYEYALVEADLLFSAETLVELQSVLRRPKFDRYVTRKHREDAYEKVLLFAQIVTPSKHFSLSADPKDNKFIDVAITGQADFIVSGDKRDLLSLGAVDGIPILSARDFWREFGPGRDPESTIS